MRCDEFEPRLNEVLDERREWLSDGELAAHARSCSACRELATSYEAALHALVATALADAHPGDRYVARGQSAGVSDLTARVLGELTPAPLIGPSLRWLRQYQYQWAMAAGVLLAVGLAWMALMRAPAGRGPAEPLAAGHHESDSASSPRREKRAAAARQDGAVEKNAASENLVAKRPVSPWPQTGHDGNPTIDRSEASAAASLPAASLEAAQWAHRVADGLKPVTRPTVGALNGFLELWGVDDPRPRS